MPEDADVRAILDRLSTLDTKIERYMARQDQRCEDAHRQMCEHHGALFTPGTGIRDRLQECESKTRLMWLGVMGFLTAGAKVVWDLIAKP